MLRAFFCVPRVQRQFSAGIAIGPTMQMVGAIRTGRAVCGAGLALAMLWETGARAEETALAADLTHNLPALADADTALRAARPTLIDCETGCIIPAEAAAMALAAGEGQSRPGRFLLDIRGGGQSLQGALGELLFVNSQVDYATFGTLTIAFDRTVLDGLLRRASVCGASDVIDGQITVKACRVGSETDLNMFNMMERLNGRRIVVDGEVRLQWIDWYRGAVRPLPGRPGEVEVGYYQVWVHVTDAAQVTFVHED